MIQYKNKDDTEWIEMRYPPSKFKQHLKTLAVYWNSDVRELSNNGDVLWEFYSCPWPHEQTYDK